MGRYDGGMKALLKLGFVLLVLAAVGLVWAGTFGGIPWNDVLSYAWKGVVVLGGLLAVAAAIVMMTGDGRGK